MKVYGYYKKQLDLFKKNQQKWLDQQKMNQKDVTKYVFADDIKKVKVRKKGLRIYFGDGEDVVFDNIEVSAMIFTLLPPRFSLYTLR